MRCRAATGRSAYARACDHGGAECLRLADPGGLGVSGDSSCADHNVAWRVRKALGLDKVAAGVNPNRKDAIVHDLGPDEKSASGWGHPKRAGAEADVANELGAGVGGASMK